jgi:hypothetical protein
MHWETQEKLRASVGSPFNDRFPVWKCSDCGWLNRYIDTFLELCCCCGKEHTLDWEKFILKQLKG